jgi:hypothetical protein
MFIIRDMASVPKIDPRTLGIPIRRLDSIQPPDNKCMSFGLIGSTRSGKTVALLYIWDTWFRDSHITIMATGSSQADIYKPLQKSAAVSPSFYPEVIKETMTLNHKTDNKYKFLHIFDDMLDGKNSKALSKLLCIGRNNGMSTIISAQELTIMNSVGRTNLNYMLLFRLNSQMAVEKVVRNYLTHILPGKNIEEKCKMYVALTQDHYCFVCDFLSNEVFITKIDIQEVPGCSGSGS